VFDSPVIDVAIGFMIMFFILIGITSAVNELVSSVFFDCG